MRDVWRTVTVCTVKRFYSLFGSSLLNFLLTCSCFRHSFCTQTHLMCMFLSLPLFPDSLYILLHLFTEIHISRKTPQCQVIWIQPHSHRSLRWTYYSYTECGEALQCKHAVLGPPPLNTPSAKAVFSGWPAFGSLPRTRCGCSNEGTKINNKKTLSFQK